LFVVALAFGWYGLLLLGRAHPDGNGPVVVGTIALIGCIALGGLSLSMLVAHRRRAPLVCVLGTIAAGAVAAIWMLTFGAGT
jgi:hypothetical protein